MKKLCVVLTLIMLVSVVAWIQAQEQVNLQAEHRALLNKDGFRHMSALPVATIRQQDTVFSVACSEQEASLLTTRNGKTYHIYTSRPNPQTVSFTIRVSGGVMDSVLVGSIERSELQYKITIDPEKSTAGFGVDTILPVALQCSENIYCAEHWWRGFLSFSPEQYESRSYYATRDEAVANVPTHVSPKYCFVWRDGSSSLPWRPIPGTGCAHWVAHQKGITSSPGCYDGYSIRVSQVTSGRTSYSISNARVGDIWTNTDQSHCGIVIAVGNGQAQVRHCSSGSGGVVVSWFSSGYAWR